MNTFGIRNVLSNIFCKHESINYVTYYYSIIIYLSTVSKIMMIISVLLRTYFYKLNLNFMIVFKGNMQTTSCFSFGYILKDNNKL